MADIFDLPLNTTHLRHQIKRLSQEKGVSFKHLFREVQRVLDRLGTVWTRRRIIARVLKVYGVNDQRTDGWHLKRSEMITASEITKAFKSATPSARRELILKKIEGAKPGDGGMNSACAHGTRFEPIAKEIYCALQGGGSVVDTSCVVHPKYPFLGASPDGIYMAESRTDPRWGKLIEFKCPVSRKFDATTPIPNEYYHQMQLQMECTNLDECDYVEMQFGVLTQSAWAASESPFKGRFAIFDDGRVLYEQGPPTRAWKDALKQGEDEFWITHWVLVQHRIATVPRDYTWMEQHLDDIRSTWEEVLHHRANGTVPEKAEKGDTLIVEREPEIDLSYAPLVSHVPVCENPVAKSDSSLVCKTSPLTLSFSFD